MNRERWQRIEALFQTAAARPTQERATFLEEACGGDTSLRQEVEALLASDTQSDAEFEEFASALAADWLVTSNQYDLVGQTIGHYRVLSGLAAGGMGEIYLGEDLTLDRKVALKFLPKHFTRDAQRLHRFEKEARAASALNHPNILTIYQFGEWQGTRFIATEYIEGETLRERLEKGRLPLPEVFEIGSQVAGALAAAHDAGLIHRDIKPANIMLRTDGYVKVLDFGLVKLTRPTAQADVTEIGRVIGTANYMSPEQALGEPLDHRTDIYSLGVVLYEMATGHRLLDAQKEGAVDEGVPHRGPTSMRGRDPGLREDLEQVIRRALARDRDSRYQSATALANDLRELAHGRGQSQAAEGSLRADAPTKWRVAKRSVATIAALSFVIAAGAAFYFSSHRPNAPAIPEKSIAVLPLVNSTGDPANEYFSDGMSEEFISSLSRLRDLKVIGRTSSFQFKGKTEDSKTIGEKLGVFYLLEGSVRKSAERVRIAVALIKSGDGSNVWSETYDRELKDIFAVQSEIAGAVAKELKIALLGTNGQSAQLTTAATPSNQNVEAYNALLQGNFHDNRLTFEDTRKAIGYYEEAIRLDPRYALAYAKLSLAAWNLANAFGDLSMKEREEANAKARVSAQKALALDPNLAEAHRAQARSLDFNFPGAEAELRRALELAPQDAAIISSLGTVMSTLGRLDEAVALDQRAIALEPLRAGTYRIHSANLTALGRYDEAEAAVRKAIELQPQAATSYEQLAIIQILRGKSGAAVEFAKKETDPFFRTYALALAHFANGDRAQADAALKKLIDENADNGASQIAQVYALRKEPDKMFEWLEHAWTTHDLGVTEILSDPFLLGYKDDPRFIAFAQKIGVMPKAAGKP